MNRKLLVAILVLQVADALFTVWLLAQTRGAVEGNPAQAQVLRFGAVGLFMEKMVGVGLLACLAWWVEKDQKPRRVLSGPQMATASLWAVFAFSLAVATWNAGTMVWLRAVGA